jgi:hypothetical protein
MKRIYFFLAMLFIAAFSSNSQTIRTVFYNPPGTDDGTEYVEILHTPSTTLTGLTLIEIDGDATTSGNINSAINLNTYTTGSNGLLLIRDAATVLSPAPSPATSVVVFNFAPDIQNGTGTFLIVSGFSGAVGNDLDAGNDGTLDAFPWTSVLNVVSVTDGTVGDSQYADDFGGVNLPDIATFATEGVVFYNSVYYAIDVTGTTPGPFTMTAAWDATGTRNTSVETLTLTPGNTLNPLPISLFNFSGYKDRSHNQLRWTTGSEQNNSGFEVQRSTDGFNYTAIGFVNTLALGGNSSSQLNYTFTDNSVTGSRQYYRLRQVDFDNHSKLSNIVLIKGDNHLTLMIDDLFPNPASTLVNVLIAAPTKDKVTLVVTDIAGRNVIQQLVNVETGSNTIPVDISRLSNGTYMVKLVCESIPIANGSERAVSKFVKQ